MNIKPLEDNVLIQLETKSCMSAGGIILPNADSKPTTYGLVLAAGPDASVKPGDKVLVTALQNLGLVKQA